MFTRSIDYNFKFYDLILLIKRVFYLLTLEIYKLLIVRPPEWV